MHGSSTFDLLVAVGPNPVESRLRWQYTPRELTAMKKHLGSEDALTGERASTLELDHRVPMMRATGNEVRVDPGDAAAVRATFQLLTRPNNLAKARACEQCVATGVIPDCLRTRNPLSGGKEYTEETGCGSCRWAHPEKWGADLAALHTNAVSGTTAT